MERARGRRASRRAGGAVRLSSRHGGEGALAIDLQALQSPMSRGRGIGRYAQSLALALEDLDPSLVGAYLLNPRFAPPAAAEALASTGKLTYAEDGLPRDCRVLHVLSPLDLEAPLSEIWRSECDTRRVAFSATVYDLIPLIEPSSAPQDPVERRRYRTRLELLRLADQLQVLSRAVGDQLVEHLAVDPERVEVVGAAPDPRFVPPTSRPQARALAQKLLRSEGLTRAFVFYPSGSHPRKNNEALVRAFAGSISGNYSPLQLLISAELDPPTRHHLRELASSLGIADRLVLAGYLSDEALLACYQGADFICFPSLAEGFGLPVLEAFACGTPVIGADRPPLDELLEPSARFDPTDVAAMTRALRAAHIEAPPSQAVGTKSWSAVATSSAAHLRQLVEGTPRRARPPRPGRRPRPTYAIVTPLPPASTGVAGYSYQLIEALVAQEKADFDVFVEGGREAAVAPPGVGVFAARSLGQIERLRGPYDEIIYTVGNSHHHLDALRLLETHRGIVLAHDVRLSNLYRHAHGDPSLRPGGFMSALRAMYPLLPTGIGEHAELSPQELERFGLYMSRDVIAKSRGFLVSSDAAAALARVEAGPALQDHVAVVPFAVAEPDRRQGMFAEERGPTPEGLGAITRLWGSGPIQLGTGPLLAHFGIVDPVKQPEKLLHTFAELRAQFPTTLLAFVGPISVALAEALSRLASTLGIEDGLLLTGGVEADDYRAWLDRATVAVQLRDAFNGEASAAVGECLACGLPTVVTHAGWARSLPKEAVASVEVDCSPIELAALIGSLLGDSTRQRELRTAAKRVASGSTFADSARELLRYLERATRAAGSR